MGLGMTYTMMSLLNGFSRHVEMSLLQAELAQGPKDLIGPKAGTIAPISSHTYTLYLH